MGQFALQLLQVFFVGLMIGTERTVIPILAKEEFSIASSSVIFAFIVSFGFAKALLNLYGGRLSESHGRKRVLIYGWFAAVPVPLILMLANDWIWVVGANILLGVNQGLAWSMTVTSKLDLSLPRERGLAVGFNEFAGYGGVALAGIITGALADTFGLRPVPLLFGLLIALSASIIALIGIKETLPFTKLEVDGGTHYSDKSLFEVFKVVSWKNKSLFSISQAGAIEKFTDALVWVAFPLFLFSRGLTLFEIGIVVGSYGAVWGILQMLIGPWSDRIGRKKPIVLGMVVCGIGIIITLLVNSLVEWILASGIIGFGMALLYPTLISAISDASEASWRGTSLGVYRMWRDAGYGFGALAIGFVSDINGLEFGFIFVALLMFVSGALVAALMKDRVSEA